MAGQFGRGWFLRSDELSKAQSVEGPFNGKTWVAWLMVILGTGSGVTGGAASYFGGRNGDVAAVAKELGDFRAEVKASLATQGEKINNVEKAVVAGLPERLDRMQREIDKTWETVDGRGPEVNKITGLEKQLGDMTAVVRAMNEKMDRWAPNIEAVPGIRDQAHANRDNIQMLFKAVIPPAVNLEGERKP